MGAVEGRKSSCSGIRTRPLNASYATGIFSDSPDDFQSEIALSSRFGKLSVCCRKTRSPDLQSSNPKVVFRLLDKKPNDSMLETRPHPVCR